MCLEIDQERLPRSVGDRGQGTVVRDRDGIYGEVIENRVENLGLEQVVIAPPSPWQNARNASSDHCAGNVLITSSRSTSVSPLRVVRSYVAYDDRTRA